MLAIGIDPGTATTGYGLVRLHDGAELECVAQGVIRTAADQPMPQRLLELQRSLNDLLHQFHPTTGAVEKLFFQRNVTTAMSVGQARGVALLALAQSAIEVGEYTPLQVKQAVVGYGGADKQQVQKMVQQLLRLAEPPRPDDAADALAVAICHLQTQQTLARYEQGSQ